MSFVIIAVKALMMVVMAVAAFSVLAMSLGVDPFAVESGGNCAAAQRPACLLMIF